MALPRGPGPFSVARAFLSDERGATAVEYGLLAGLIALVVIGAMSAVFTGIGKQFNNISNSL